MMGVSKVPPALTDGSRLYYMTVFRGNVLYQVSVTGGGAAPISEPFPGLYAELEGISPSGSELLAVGSEGGSTGEGPLWVVPILTGSRHRLASIVCSGASWSPDGQTIVFAKGKGQFKSCTKRWFGSTYNLDRERNTLLDSMVAGRQEAPFHSR